MERPYYRTQSRTVLDIIVVGEGHSWLFVLAGSPPYILYIPYISFIYSMYVYNYIHIWQAARNVENPPASNYVSRVQLREKGSSIQRNAEESWHSSLQVLLSESAATAPTLFLHVSDGNHSISCFPSGNLVLSRASCLLCHPPTYRVHATGATM